VHFCCCLTVRPHCLWANKRRWWWWWWWCW